MKPLRTVLIDDEALARRGLRLRLERFSDIDIVSECENGEQALRCIQSLRPDLVFLDIQMPGLNGFEVVQRLPADAMPLIIFVTALNHHAIDAFNVHAVDYLLKPTDDARLRLSVNRALLRCHEQRGLEDKERLMRVIAELKIAQGASAAKGAGQRTETASPQVGRLAIREDGRTRYLPMQDIEWIDAAGDYMCVHVQQQTHIVRSTMKQLQRDLDASLFQRIHRSTLVNVDKISELLNLGAGDTRVRLTTGVELKVSRGRKQALKRALRNR